MKISAVKSKAQSVTALFVAFFALFASHQIFGRDTLPAPSVMKGSLYRFCAFSAVFVKLFAIIDSLNNNVEGIESKILREKNCTDERSILLPVTFHYQYNAFVAVSFPGISSLAQSTIKTTVK